VTFEVNLGVGSWDLAVETKRLIVAITGATGAIYGVRVLQQLRGAGIDTHLVISRWGARTLLHETSWSREEVDALATATYAPADMGAVISSGSFRTDGMVIVPYGHVWRTGANEATQFVVTDDVTINGQKLAAGSYSLHTIPGKDEWTIVFNGTANQWGSFDYDPAKDTLRVKVKPEWVKDNQESLAFSFDPVTDNSATVNIRWEKALVPFTVEVDVPKVALARAREAVAAAKSDNYRVPLNAASYAKQNKDDADAASWLAQALKAADESIKAKETFDNLSAKVNILYLLGRKDEALAVADKAIERGRADKADTAAFEKRIADIKAGKM